jgi:selenoprotein W-related protein
MSNLPRIEIEYCTQCRWLLRAAWMAQELLTTFEQEIGEVALRPGTGGVFDVGSTTPACGRARPRAAFPTSRS